jgi:hypothetical protein
MVRQAMLLAGVTMALVACAAVDTPGTREPLDAFTHRVATSEVVLR